MSKCSTWWKSCQSWGRQNAACPDSLLCMGERIRGLTAAVFSLKLLMSSSHSIFFFLVGNGSRARLSHFHAVREEIWSGVINNGTDFPKCMANSHQQLRWLKKNNSPLQLVINGYETVRAWCILCICREGTGPSEVLIQWDIRGPCTTEE